MQIHGAGIDKEQAGDDLAQRVPFLVDVGVLLDVFAGVFVMGIVVFHMNRAFDSLDTSNFVELGD